MNILHIGKYYPPYHGGMENYLSDLAYQQNQQGHDVTVFVHNHQWRLLTSSSEQSTQDGITIIRQKSIRPILFTPIMLGLRKKLKQLFKIKQYDVIHWHWPNPSLFWLLFFSFKPSVSLVFSWHSDMVTEHSSWLLKLVYCLIKPLENKLLNQADSVLVSSQNYADHSPQLIKYAGKTHVIPLGIRTDQIAADSSYKQPNAWQTKQFRIFNLGRFTFYKNQQLLIKAMAGLDQCELIVAGNGQLESSIKAKITEHQVAGKVMLLTEQSWSQVHAIFATCDLFCMASHDRAESFGVVLLEAMFHDKIILVPDTLGSGMQWLAENYNKGFTYQANNSKDFIAQVNAIREDFKQIKSRPKQFDYDIKDIAALVESHYLKIIKNRRSQ